MVRTHDWTSFSCRSHDVQKYSCNEPDPLTASRSQHLISQERADQRQGHNSGHREGQRTSSCVQMAPLTRPAASQVPRFKKGQVRMWEQLSANQRLLVRESAYVCSFIYSTDVYTVPPRSQLPTVPGTMDLVVSGRTHSCPHLANYVGLDTYG